MTIDTSRLIELAGKATPGPWRSEVDNVFAGPEDNSEYVAYCDPMRWRTPAVEANAAYIAAADPTTVSELCRQRDELLALARPFIDALEDIDDGTPINLRAPDSMPLGDALYEGQQPTVGDMRALRAAIKSCEAE